MPSIASHGLPLLLEGGLDAWRAAGFETFIDVNVPSKAFGELVESRRHTPLLPAEEVRRLIDSEKPPVILDARRFDEFNTMSIPTGTSVPGAELVLRVRDLAPDPETTVIVNCAGLSARELAGDDRLIPVRGQTITVHAPWIKMFTNADGAYIYPKADGNVTLGGIKQFGNSNPDVDQSDKDWIWNRCTELQPSLKNCQVLYDWVGLRPFRQPIRVESEILSR